MTAERSGGRKYFWKASGKVGWALGSVGQMFCVLVCVCMLLCVLPDTHTGYGFIRLIHGTVLKLIDGVCYLTYSLLHTHYSATAQLLLAAAEAHQKHPTPSRALIKSSVRGPGRRHGLR